MRIRERLRWRPTGATIAIVLLFVWQLFLQPIWNLNIERIAEQEKIDGALRDSLPSIGGITVPNAVIEWVSYLTGPFLTGFVVAAAIFGLGPSIANGITWIALRTRAHRLGETITPEAVTKQKSYDGDVIPRRLWVRAIPTDDGIDIYPVLCYRNRSQQDLYFTNVKVNYVLDGKSPHGAVSESLTAPLKKEVDTFLKYRPIRMYETNKRISGEVSLLFSYGLNKNDPLTRINITYRFVINDIPKTLNPNDDLKVFISEEVTYKPVRSHDQSKVK